MIDSVANLNLQLSLPKFCDIAQGKAWHELEQAPSELFALWLDVSCVVKLNERKHQTMIDWQKNLAVVLLKQSFKCFYFTLTTYFFTLL